MAITENMIEVRAIELIQQMQLTQPGLNLVKNKRMLEHEFGHLILGYPPSVFGEAYIGAQWQAALSFAEGDGAEYTRIRQLFIDSSVRDRKTSQQIYSYDLHQNNDDGVNDQQMTNVKIHTIEEPEYHDFIKLFDKTDEVSVIRQKQAASIFFDATMKEIFPVAKKLIEIHDGKRPSYDDIANVRVIIHLDKNEIDFRGPTIEELEQDQRLNKIRDIATGMFDQKNIIPLYDSDITRRIDPKDWEIFYFVMDSKNSQVVQQIAEQQSVLVMPDPDPNKKQGIPVALWRRMREGNLTQETQQRLAFS